MADLDLRPLSLGEILDRTFTLYRRNFVLFLGIAALPHLLVLALHLAQTAKMPMVAGRQSQPLDNSFVTGGILVILTLIAQLFAYLFTQGGTVFAVSELYLGRQTAIGQSFARMRGELANLFGVLLLNGIIVFGAPLACFVTAAVTRAPAMIFLALVLMAFPGFYLACRLMVCVPAALLENIGPRSSLERSFALTKDNAGRAFVVYLLYIILLWAAASLLTWPFAFGVVSAQKDPVMMRTWLALTQIGSFVAEVLVGPFLTIAASVYYFDLRVRKEAFDLQFMMNPGATMPAGTPGVPSMFS